MKICWDYLEDVRYIPKTGNFNKNGNTYIYHERCKVCGQPFLGNRLSITCSKSCGKTGDRNPNFGKGELFIGDKNPFYKRKHSKKVVEGLRKLHSGVKKTEEHKKKIGKALSGDNNPMKNPETAKKSRLSNLKSPKRQRGEKHWNWRGGGGPYCPVFNNKGWREHIFERDKEKHCWNPQCMSKSQREVLHHINYDKQDCRYSNIIKVCNGCNAQANVNRSWWEAFYTETMRRRNL